MLPLQSLTKYLFNLITFKNKTKKINTKTENIIDNFFLYSLLKIKLNEKIISKDNIAFLSPDKTIANTIIIKKIKKII